MILRTDRSLTGIIMMAMVVSTLITAFIIGDVDDYSIVKEIRPYWIRQLTGETYAFALTMVANKELGSLGISHYTMVNRSDKITNVSREGSPDEIARRIPEMEAYLAAASMGPGAAEVSSHRVEVGEREYEMILYDFSRIVWSSVPPEIMRSTKRPRTGIGFLWDFYDCFAILLDGEGRLAHYYQGVADFFLQRVISIKELIVEFNEEKQAYYGGTVEEGADGGSILNSPPRGVLLFERLKRNDRIGILYQVDGGGVPATAGILHLTAITVNEGEPIFIDSPM